MEFLPQAARADLVRGGPFPVPSGAQVRVIRTADDVPLRLASWRATIRRRDELVLILQGRTEYIERYGETILILIERGFDVVAFDWRGQGGSARLLPDRRKGHVERFEDYLLDLNAVIASLAVDFDPKRRMALAHSMGGAVLLHALHRVPALMERAVLSAPMIGLSMVRYQTLAHLAARTFKTMGLGKFYIPGGSSEPLMPFQDNPLTHDQKRFDVNEVLFSKAPELAIGSPTISWIKTSFDAMRALQDPRFASKLSMPLLCVAGSHDRITDTRATARFIAGTKQGRLLEIADAAHEILLEAETIRQAFWRAFDDFMD